VTPLADDKPPDASADLTSLLEAARGGSGEALGRLLDACRQYLLLVANQELDPELRAKVNPSDVVQETFLEAQRAFNNFRGTTEGELLAWLRRILRNNLANVTRHFAAERRQVRREVSLDCPESGGAKPPDQAAKLPSPSSGLVEREEAEALQAAFRRLPEDYRRVIEMRHVQGRSFAEVGAALGRSAGAVRKLWVRAIEQLKAELRRPDEPTG